MAELYILNQDRERIDIIDDYKSLIWTPRFYECGDFEIYIKASERTLSLLHVDNYVTRPDSDMVGIIEKVQTVTDPDEGDHIIASGRCAKSLIGRRVVWFVTNISDTVENGIRRLLTENLIAPKYFYREMPNFVLGESQGFTETMSAQYTGDNVLEVIVNLCKQNGYGFKVILNDDKNFEFQLMKGTNRSYGQSENPYVVFSPEFENVITSTYEHDTSQLKNACRVAGEGEGVSRKVYDVGATTGLKRREMFVDARDITSELEDGSTLSATDYNRLLVQRGFEQIRENAETILFEGEVESMRQFVFGRDFFLGDVVTVKNGYGVTKDCQVVGVVLAHDENGETVIPVFSFTDVYGDDENYLLTEDGEKLMTEDEEEIVV